MEVGKLCGSLENDQTWGSEMEEMTTETVGSGQFGKGLECQMGEFGFILRNKREVTCIGVLWFGDVEK